MDSSDEDDELGERMTDADHRAVMEDLLNDGESSNLFRRRNNQVTNQSNESDDQVESYVSFLI